MAAGERRVRVWAHAKLNLDLKVLNKGPEGFHELRSVFQTISLRDAIEISYRPSKTVELSIDGSVDIPDNLILKAARLLFAAAGVGGRVHFGLSKTIPMGAGMGGGSSDAAAVLLALPVLAGLRIDGAELRAIAAQLGSDVPFFLLGGTAVALDRGTELYPLADVRSTPILVVAPGIHVSTPEAYRAFDRAGNGKLTEAERSRYIDSFQSRVWRLGESLSRGGVGTQLENDFEGVVFPRHPHLKSILKNLGKSGAIAARMTGSGSALFGVFTTQEEVREAAAACRKIRPQPAVFAVRTVDRGRYRSSWWRQLQEHMDGKVWPPQSRYALRRQYA